MPKDMYASKPDGDNSQPSVPSVELVGQGDQRHTGSTPSADPTPCMPGAK
jgi:hypothetical protein